ncbi:helix-turn-helix domain-containing protein [Marinobacterium jannaschii]|uniref:helix-turn-helix domain-containing protein n=1 Tax=Marinobacterium jannaschii TaxID=64970 RepID=UPI000489B52D|nr:helix-turn-helix transcriptional regulator [Marinobacterium jannaschii]
MSQTVTLVETLKKQLRARGLTYRDVAEALDLSEASVKRLFSEYNFTLNRLEAIAQLAGMQLSELVAIMSADMPQLKQLTREQEQVIADDLPLLMVAVSVINGFSFGDLLQQYQLSETDCIGYLAKLDRLRIIELQPRNRIRLLVSPNFRWLPNGPIQRFFLDKVQQDFFNSGFDKSTESLVVLNGVLSQASNAELQKKMQRLARDFNELLREDAALSLDERKGTTMVLALRQWQFKPFKRLQK